MARKKQRKGPSTHLLLAGLCVFSFVAALSAERYVIAYVPFGGGWSSRIVFTNPTDQAVNVELLFFDGNGLTAFTVSELGLPGERQIRLHPGAAQSVDVTAARNEHAQIGWAVAETDAPLQVFSTFDFSVPDCLLSM